MGDLEAVDLEAVDLEAGDAANLWTHAATKTSDFIQKLETGMKHDYLVS